MIYVAYGYFFPRGLDSEKWIYSCNTTKGKIASVGRVRYQETSAYCIGLPLPGTPKTPCMGSFEAKRSTMILYSVPSTGDDTVQHRRR